MRVALIIPSFYPAVVYGGSTFASYHLTKEVAELGVGIWVSTTNANGKEALSVPLNHYTDLSQFKVKYYREEIREKLSISLLRGLWKDIKQADIVHLQAIFSYPTPIALLYAFLQRKKVLFSPRGSFSPYTFSKRSFIKNLWMKFCIHPWVKNVEWHATSLKELKEIKRLFPQAKVHLLSDGTYLSEKLIVKEKGRRYMAALGRIHPVKNYELLIKCMPDLLTDYPDLQLKIAGKDDGALSSLKSLVVQLGLEEQVLFVGELNGEEKDAFLAEAAVLMMPSHTENFGIVCVEALAQGTAVIASKNTPWKVLEEKGAGLWVENSKEEWLKASRSLLEEKAESRQKNALSLAKEYDWKHLAKQYQQLLEMIHHG
jgi:glycosyltransferase involved in cell wall biosynthesis